MVKLNIKSNKNLCGITFSNKEIIKEYRVNKQSFSPKEKILFTELRENLVDLAISAGVNFNENERDLLYDIKGFLFRRLSKDDLDLPLTEEYLDKLSRNFLQNLLGYGEIDPLIRDDNLEEIMVIGVNKPVYVYHRKFGMMRTNVIFKEESDLLALIDAIARQINRRIDQESPILDGRLLDGSRVNATIAPISADGPSLTIRKFKKDPLTIIDLIKSKTISLDLASFFWLTLDGLGVKSANVIISGGTSSGKTTTLNALSAFVNPKERIITIEDTLELQIPHDHVIRMETRPANVENKGELTMNDLVKNSLRQRPDRIIVGEVRGSEAITLFTALNTGHSGIGTLHSNDARETITRLTNAPMSVPSVMINAIDFIVMQNRIYRPDGVSFRRVSEVAEVVGFEEGVVQLNKIFQWNPESDTIENVSISSKTLNNIANLSGCSMKEIYDELENRKNVLKFMVLNNLRSDKDVKTFFEAYYLDSEALLNKILLKS